MSGISQTHRAAFCAAAAIALTACAESTTSTQKAASQEPVDPAPGLYELTHSAGMYGLTARDRDGKEKDTYCLRKHKSAAFPDLVASYYAINPSCTTRKEPRQGNLITGTFTCPADQKMATGSNRFVYEGIVAAESVKISIQIKFDAELKEGAAGELGDRQMKLAMKAMERAKLGIEATRIGDCA